MFARTPFECINLTPATLSIVHTYAMRRPCRTAIKMTHGHISRPLFSGGVLKMSPISCWSAIPLGVSTVLTTTFQKINRIRANFVYGTRRLIVEFLYQQLEHRMCLKSLGIRVSP